MKKLKYLLLSLCLLLGMTGCGRSDLSSVFEEMIQSGVLEEILQNGVLDELLQKDDVQFVEVPEGELEVHFIDVGQADCALLASGGHFMLIDGGNNDDAERIVSYLKQQGVEKLDIVVGTHPHEDHIGSLDAAIKAFSIGSVYMPDVSTDTDTYKDVIDAVNAKGLNVKNPKPGDVLDFNGLPVEVFAPVKEYKNLNNDSIVLRVSVGEKSFLFTGDVEAEAEFDIMDQGFDLSTDVLKVSHHGSSGSSVEEFLAYTDAEYAVISVGVGNNYGHPETVTLKRLQSYGMQIFRTDKQGTIICSTDGKDISFRQLGHVGQTDIITDTDYVGNIKTLKYHELDCGSLPIEKNRIYFVDKEEAAEAGYAPCGSCRP